MAFINGTLILQAAHFIIAFYIIKYFFFKPVFAHIEIEDALQESLVSAVQEHQAAVAQKEHELSDHWHTLRSYFTQQAPSLKRQRLVIPKQSITVPDSMTPADVQHAVQSLAKKLVSRVDHVA